MTLLLACCLTFTPQPVNNHIDWAAIENYTLYEHQYEWHETSGIVGFLQYWLKIDIDNVYGTNTHRAHRQHAMQNGHTLPLYDINVADRDFGPAVEQWRLLVKQAIQHFGGPVSDVPRFLRIMQCESNGDPNAYNESSGASGLMQHLHPPYWEARTRSAGYPDASPFNAEANIYASAYIIYHSPNSWQHWVCT